MITLAEFLQKLRSVPEPVSTSVSTWVNGCAPNCPLSHVYVELVGSLCMGTDLALIVQYFKDFIFLNWNCAGFHCYAFIMEYDSMYSTGSTHKDALECGIKKATGDLW